MQQGFADMNRKANDLASLIWEIKAKMQTKSLVIGIKL
jgi:hypothetical protein